MNKQQVWPLALGFAGLLPQAGFAALASFGGADLHYWAITIGWAYAAMIFSFLGGVYWGLGAAKVAQGKPVSALLWLAAVAPSLIAIATFLPWITGDEWPGPALIILGVLIALTPTLIDRHLAAFTPSWWLPFRMMLSLGLGGLTILLGLVSNVAPG